jgi:hypothetical protein
MISIKRAAAKPSFFAKNSKFIFSIIPILFLIGMITQYTIDLPLMDQWDLIPMFDKVYNGQLTIHDLWEQHNEHRIFFPKLIMILLALLTKWNIYYEIATSVLIAIGIYLTLMYQFKETFKENKIELKPFLYLVISLLVFSSSQQENWTWGFQIQIFMNVLAIIVGSVLLAHRSFKWWKFGLGLFAAIVATYSFANGGLFWVLAFFIFPFISISKKHKIIVSLIWLITSVVTLYSYYKGYHKPGGHPSLTYILHHPLEFLKYTFAYLGAPLAQFNNHLAILFGFIGLCLIIVLIILVFIQKNIRFSSIIPWIIIASYSILSSLVSAVGRAGFGYEQALSSRYITISTPLWISILALFFILNKQEIMIFSRKLTKQKMKASTFILMTILVIFFFNNSKFGIDAWKNRYEYFLPTRANVISGTDENLAKRVYPDLNVYNTNKETLKKLKISVFRNE